jgi:hypothetical protein
MKERIGKIRIGKNEYTIEVKNGIRCIDGKTVKEFMKTLDKVGIERMAKVGAMALDDEKKGVKFPKGKYQYYAICDEGNFN